MASPFVMRGSIVRIDGVLHMVWGLRGVGESRLTTYCRRDALAVPETLTRFVTCIAIRARVRARDLENRHRERSP